MNVSDVSTTVTVTHVILNFPLSKTLSSNSASPKQSRYYYSTIDTMCLMSGFAVLFCVKSFVGV